VNCLLDHKKLSTDHSPDRNDQFLYLGDLGSVSNAADYPSLASIPRSANWWATSRIPSRAGIGLPAESRTTTSPSDATGVAIPYGIYDLLANRGSVMVGVSHDTSAFAADATAYWWHQEGSVRYPRSRQLLILSDTGGRKALVAAPGKPSSSLNWPVRLA
jgi:hypothetical protein